MPSFGEWLRDERTRLEMTLQDIVDNGADCTVSYLSNLERNYPLGKDGSPPKPSRRIAVSVARALGVEEQDALRAAGLDSTGVIDTVDSDTRDKMVAFGRRLSDALYAARKQQKDLAAALGVSETIVSKWIAGEKSPMFGKIDEIARFVDCQVGWLYGDDNARGPGHDTIATSRSHQDPLIKLFLSEVEKINRRMDLLDPSSGGRLNRQLATSAL